MKEKEIHIGTKYLALVVAYSKIEDEVSANIDPEEWLGINRGDYTNEDIDKLDRVWGDDEIDAALKKAAKELVSLDIIPIIVKSFVDDRFEELSEEQMQTFIEYCEAEAGGK